MGRSHGTLRAAASGSTRPLIELEGVRVQVGGATLLRDVTLRVADGEHLALLGPNGAGKTTLLRVLSTRLYPSGGAVEVLGVRFGRDDLRAARTRIGFVSVALDALDRARARVDHLVAAAATGSTWPVGDPFAAAGARASLRDEVDRALRRVGIAHLAQRRVDTLSQGERQRVRIARALSLEPELLLLDEPFAGMDLGGRERLLADLDLLLAEPHGPTVVLVTHHLEELPVGMRSAALLRGGRVVAAGACPDVLDSAAVSAAFDLPIDVRYDRGRYSAVAVAARDPDVVAREG
jgi:iron complex transport system ATP-binding protein